MNANSQLNRPGSNLYLVGLMGTGKSTVGKLLAKKLKMEFIDSDEEIEKASSMSIAEMFSKHGEQYFRKMEMDFVNRGHPLEDCLVSCGGGLCIPPGMMESLKEKGKVICLWARIETLLERTKADESRPLLQTARPLNALKKLLEEREKRYKESDWVIETDNLTPEQVTELIFTNLRNDLV